MASNARLVAREVRFFADRTLSPDALSRSLAGFARAERDRVIAEGRAQPQYTTTVDGREGALEETVKPTGLIVYEFGDIAQVIGFLLGHLITNSPVKEGVFRKSWALAVDGRPFTGDLSQIPPRAEIMIVNLAPYARKVETGAMPRMRMGRDGIEAARQAVQPRFPHYSFAKTYVILPSSFGALTDFEMPYILRGRQRSLAVKHASRIALNRGRSVATNRSELTKGEILPYPALRFSRKAD